MTQGTVTMSLADIDNLRNEVKAATEAKRKIEDELKDVKNDKRVIKITKYPATVDLYVNIPSNLQPLTQQTITHVLNSIEGNRGIDNWGRSSYKCERRRISVNISNQFGHNDEQMEFINFEDVKESLRDEAAKEFINELSTLRSQQTNHELQIANLKKSYELEWVKHTANTDNTISKITEDYQKEIDNLKLKIEELETGNKKKTEIEELNHKIEGLEKALEEERSKKWYSKLFK